MNSDGFFDLLSLPPSVWCLCLSGAAVMVQVTLRGDERGVGCHLIDVDVGGVEEDVVLAAEAGEDGSDARHELWEGGPVLGFRVPALNHDIISTKKREKPWSYCAGFICTHFFKPKKFSYVINYFLFMAQIEAKYFNIGGSFIQLANNMNNVTEPTLYDPIKSH